ncbi:TB2/DP1, HVA22 family-domain-containing protein [Coemansia mojavensis]|nr:TB2/DP1, HVA22 family-domain-containing protein [Coemansia mojavensis]
MFGLATRVLCVSVGYLFPAYKCFKLIRGGPEAVDATPDDASRRDVVKGILKHWVVMAGFTAVELVTDTFLFWLPLVGLVKIGFVVWLVLPGIHGSEVIYNYIVEPHLVKNEEQLDRYFQQARAAAHRSTEKVSMTAYDRWVGYMQRVVSQSDAGASSAVPEQTEGGGLGGLLKSVSQKVPQPSTAASYLASMAGISQKPQTDQPNLAEKPSMASMLTSWAASFSVGSSAGISDQQRLQSIQTRKLQLQKLVLQLENSERTIIDRNSAKPADKPEDPSPQTDASEFEDDAVMVGQPSADSNAGSNARKETATDSAESDGSKPQPVTSTSSRRWFW